MQFSALDVIDKQRQMIDRKKHQKDFLTRFVDRILYGKEPTYTFFFYVPTYTYMRAEALCEDMAFSIEEETFYPGDLARVLYEDFLEYTRRTNNLDVIFKQLQARDLSPIELRTVDKNSEFIFEEYRGYERIETVISHKSALRGEFILRDMLEIYTDHNYTLENILEILFRDFIDDFRRGLVKDPLQKIKSHLRQVHLLF